MNTRFSSAAQKQLSGPRQKTSCETSTPNIQTVPKHQSNPPKKLSTPAEKVTRSKEGSGFIAPPSRTPKRKQSLEVSDASSTQATKMRRLNPSTVQNSVLQSTNHGLERLREEWKRRIKSLVFFFDTTVDYHKVVRFHEELKIHGSTASPFLGKNVTHLICQESVSCTNSNLNTLLPPSVTKGKTPNEIMAEKYSIRRWTLKRFEDVLVILKNDPSLKPRGLANIVQHDQLYGTQSTKSQKSFYTFKDKYLLVEDVSGSYKAIYTKEYGPEEGREYPKYPKIHRTAKVPFMLRTSSDLSIVKKDSIGNYNKEESSDISDAEEEIDSANNTMKNIYSTASGLISGSVTTLVRPSIKNQQFDRLEEKTFIKVSKHSSSRMPVTEKSVEKKQSRSHEQNVSAFFSKPGYCENCVTKYEDFYAHIHTKAHISWKNNPKNFMEIDQFIKRNKRIVRPDFATIFSKWKQDNQENDSPDLLNDAQDIIQMHGICTLLNQYRLGLETVSTHPWKTAAVALLLHATSDTSKTIPKISGSTSVRDLCAWLSEFYGNLGNKMTTLETSAAPSSTNDAMDDVESVNEPNIEGETTGCLCCTDIAGSLQQECAIKNGLLKAYESGDTVAFDLYCAQWKRKIASGQEPEASMIAEDDSKSTADVVKFDKINSCTNDTELVHQISEDFGEEISREASVHLDILDQAVNDNVVADSIEVPCTSAPHELDRHKAIDDSKAKDLSEDKGNKNDLEKQEPSRKFSSVYENLEALLSNCGETHLIGGYAYTPLCSRTRSRNRLISNDGATGPGIKIDTPALQMANANRKAKTVNKTNKIKNSENAKKTVVTRSVFRISKKGNIDVIDSEQSNSTTGELSMNYNFQIKPECEPIDANLMLTNHSDKPPQSPTNVTPLVSRRSIKLKLTQTQSTPPSVHHPCNTRAKTTRVNTGRPLDPAPRRLSARFADETRLDVDDSSECSLF